MLVKYAGNRNDFEAATRIRVRSTGKTVHMGGTGEVTEDEFQLLNQRFVLEVVAGSEDEPKALEDMTMDELKDVAELERIEVENKRSKEGYLTAIRDAREKAAAGTGLPATAPTGSPSDAGSPTGHVGNSAPAGDGGGTPVV